MMIIMIIINNISATVRDIRKITERDLNGLHLVVTKYKNPLKMILTAFSGPLTPFFNGATFFLMHRWICFFILYKKY